MKNEIITALRKIGAAPADILLPAPGIDLRKWAVVACDQFTSQKEYWKSVEEETAGVPTTDSLIFPECYLEDGDRAERIVRINRAMEDYLEKDVFTEYKQCFILVERTTESGSRFGLMAALDLDKYSYAPDSKTPIRATEGTILSRIPPRKEIRKNAPLELPHIMVLISDAERRIIEPLRDRRSSLHKVYDTDLMKNGGHIRGYLVDDENDLKGVLEGFEALVAGLNPYNPLLFAMGDGNHSLATAKSIWEDVKAGLSEEERENHPARWALVELENIFDEALLFEPIHRVFFSLSKQAFEDKLKDTAKGFTKEKATDLEDIKARINTPGQHFGYIDGSSYEVYTMEEPKSSTAAGTLQSVIDAVLSDKLAEIDYIHGMDVTEELGKKPGNIGIILPEVSKETFFESILRDRAFPRKTFSIGHANEKRYYLEARKIR